MDPSFNLATTVTTAMQTAVTDTLTMFAALLPVALTVFAAIWGTKKGISFFKSTTK